MSDYLSACRSARYELLMESHVYVDFNLKPKPYRSREDLTVKLLFF